VFDKEVQAAGLLQDRTIEASAMGEVPVITRRPVVREEVVLRKAAEERTEIIRDTVRRTATEITELGSEPGRDRRPPYNLR
jgi:stress response protein YsnF